MVTQDGIMEERRTDRGSIDRGMDRSRGSRFQDIQDVGYRRHVEHRESMEQTVVRSTRPEGHRG